MKKADILKVAIAAVGMIQVGKPFTQDMKDTVEAKLIAELGPKSGGGAKRNVDDIIKVENGKTVAIFDTIAKVWLPATLDYFYEDKSDKVDPKLNGLKNHSKAREKLTKEQVKFQKQAKDVVWAGSVESKVLSDSDVSVVLSSVPKLDYSRIVPYGSEKAGTIKPSLLAAKFEEVLAKAKGKVEAASKTAKVTKA